MSVNTSEEYLDELLQAIEPIINLNEPVQESETKAENIVESNMQTETANMQDEIMQISQSEAASLSMEESMEQVTSFEGESQVPEAGTVLSDLVSDEMETEPVSETKEETVSMDDLLSALTSEESAEEEELSMSENDIDAMLNAAVNAAEADTYDTTTQDEDVKELLKQFTDDEDLTDISDILERNDNSEAVDESVLVTPDVEVFQLEEETEEDPEKENTREAKGVLGFLKKKKNKKRGKKDKSVTDDNTTEIAEESKETADSETTIVDVDDEKNISELADVTEISEEVPIADSMGAESSLDALFEESDVADIDLLLSGVAFQEVDNKQEESGEEVIGGKAKDKKSSKKKEKGEKKESFFAKVFNMLMEEEEEDAPKKSNVPEVDATGVTDENVAILDELSKEDKKKAKLEKKEQKKKEKEAKKKGKNVAEGEEEEEEQTDDKKNKKGKKTKIKKEKPRKVVDLDTKPEKKLSRKKVTIIFAFCFSILAMILILQNVVLDLSNLKAARWAFDNADYETCYAKLYGEERSDEDEAIFQKSYVILCVQRKWDSYENLKQMGMDVEALNALFEGVRVYRDMEARANELGILDRISGIYRTIYDTLSGYGLSNEDIEEILDYKSKVTYTKRLQSIVNGTPFEVIEMPVLNEETVIEELQPQPLEDVLPQEEDFLPEDTSEVNAQKHNEEMLHVAEIAEESQGNTVVVGSAPVDISETSQNSGNGNIGGTNVGNGDTNLSAPVSGDNVFVN